MVINEANKTVDIVDPDARAEFELDYRELAATLDELKALRE